jgi:hypothetical protein
MKQMLALLGLSALILTGPAFAKPVTVQLDTPGVV